MSPKVKAAIWAVSHIASCTHGLALLPDDTFALLTTVAEESPVLSLRGTCLYAMSLLAMSEGGMRRLVKLGWHCATNAGDR